MGIISLILCLSVVSLWFASNEYDMLSGVFAPTCVMRLKSVGVIMMVVFLIAVCISRYGDVRNGIVCSFSSEGIDAMSVLVMTLSSLIVLLAFRMSNIKGSVIYTYLGSSVSYAIMAGIAPEAGWDLFLSFVVASLMAFLLSGVFRFILVQVFSRVSVHMVVISYYMRNAVIFCMMLMFFALGLNLGGTLFGFGDMVSAERAVNYAVPVVVILAICAAVRHGGPTDEPSGIFADFSIYAVLSVGAATALTMMFFSFDATASLLGLQPVPLSALSLILPAVFGTELAQKGRIFGTEEYIKGATATIAPPLASFLLTYLLMSVMGMDNEDIITDYVVLTAIVLSLAGFAFFLYAKRVRTQRIATEHIVQIQQQQIYEHSRALNDMELKVVLSENQALHRAVEAKKQEVMSVALGILEQRGYLETLNGLVSRLSMTDDPAERNEIIAELGNSLKQRLSYDSDVDSQFFYAKVESLHEDFNAKLSAMSPVLTQQEKRLATLLRLGFSSKYIATLMNITPKSVEISRYRLRQKLGLSKGDNLVSYIKSI